MGRFIKSCNHSAMTRSLLRSECLWRSSILFDGLSVTEGTLNAVVFIEVVLSSIDHRLSNLAKKKKNKTYFACVRHIRHATSVTNVPKPSKHVWVCVSICVSVCSKGNSYLFREHFQSQVWQIFAFEHRCLCPFVTPQNVHQRPGVRVSSSKQSWFFDSSWNSGETSTEMCHASLLREWITITWNARLPVCYDARWMCVDSHWIDMPVQLLKRCIAGNGTARVEKVTARHIITAIISRCLPCRVKVTCRVTQPIFQRWPLGVDGWCIQI